MSDLPYSGELRGDIQRRVNNGEIADPMWVNLSALGPSTADILDAEGDELAKLQKLAHEPAEATEEKSQPSRKVRRSTQ